MARRLAVAVHVEHPDTHEPLVLLPGDEPEEAVEAAITNPFAWEQADADEEPEPEDDGDQGDSKPDAEPKPDTEQPAKTSRARTTRKAEQ
jgi:hypothetical protein